MRFDRTDCDLFQAFNSPEEGCIDHTQLDIEMAINNTPTSDYPDLYFALDYINYTPEDKWKEIKTERRLARQLNCKKKQHKRHVFWFFGRSPNRWILEECA